MLLIPGTPTIPGLPGRGDTLSLIVPSKLILQLFAISVA
jgi:hypothetical protein